jgi:hypothetical protein
MLVASYPKYAIPDGSISPDMLWITFKNSLCQMLCALTFCGAHQPTPSPFGGIYLRLLYTFDLLVGTT